MAAPFPVLVHLSRNTIFFFLFYHFFTVHGLTGGSSLSVDNNDILYSSNGIFTAGFHQVGENAYCFAVWFTEQPTTGGPTVVWMANRDAPVNGKYSKLSLLKNGNLVLTDADQYVIWSTHTNTTSSSFQLQLHDTGNLVLSEGEKPLWQSFDHPTDTLLPYQLLTENTRLVSSRSSTNYSSGFYKLFFDIDSILRLIYESPASITPFWPDSGRYLGWFLDRYKYMDSQRAILYPNGRFESSDGRIVLTADFGVRRQRLVKLDIDGNLRVYSLIEHQGTKKWQVQWQAISHSCKVRGICGPNSLCSYSRDSDSGRRCTCLHGYKMVNSEDWSYGCAPEFEGCRPQEEGFFELQQIQFYGDGTRIYLNYTTDACKKDCLDDCNCKGFLFAYDYKTWSHYILLHDDFFG